MTASAGARKRAEQRHYDAAVGSQDLSGYDWSSGAHRLQPLLRAPYQQLERWLAARCAGRDVLDFGCGQGFWIVHPARCGARATGVDLSGGSLAVAARRAAVSGLVSRTAFVLGDCESLPFPANSFDIVMSCGTLSCLDLTLAIREMTRVLRPGGQAIVVETLGHNPLLNWRRRNAAARGVRTRHTVDHILTLNGIHHIVARFRRSRLRFFDIATVAAAAVLGDWSLQQNAARWLMPLDAALLRLPGARRFAFKVVVELANPIK